MQLLRFVDVRTLVLYREVLPQCLEELFRGQSVEVFYHTVIVEDGELRSLEAYRHEVVVLLVATVVRILLLFLLTHESCCCRAVMTIGNIQ